MFNGVPTGVITAWFGMSTAVPEGWTICDGTNGTPDLRGRTIIGVNGTDAAADASVGSAVGTNSLSIQTNNMPNHSHAIGVNGTANFSGTGSIKTKTRLQSDNHYHEFWPQMLRGPGPSGSASSVYYVTHASGENTKFVTANQSANHSHDINDLNATINSSGSISISGNTSAAGMGLPVDITPAARRLHYIMKV